MDRARVLVVTLAGILILLAALLVRPFLEFFLLAVLLAYPLRPLQERFEGRLGPRLTAGSLVVGATLAIVLPVLWLLRIVIREGTAFLDRVREGEITFAELEAQIHDTTGREVDLLESAQQFLQETGIGTVNGALGLFGRLTGLLIGVALTMFLLYYFLKDAERFNRWLRATAPLPDRIYDDLRTEFDDVVWAVLASHVLIAVFQGVVAGIGLLVLGIPNAVFWTAAMIFLAVLPIIGSFLVWGPASVYLLAAGEPLAGTVLFVYGAIVVSFCDDFLRPVVIDRYTETRLNPSAIIVGILGGVYLLGFIGIFFGPVLIGSLRAVLDVYRREYVQTDQDPEAGPESEPAEEPQALAGTDPAEEPQALAETDPTTGESKPPDPPPEGTGTEN